MVRGAAIRSKGLRLMLTGLGIRSNVVQPGATMSSMWDKYFANFARSPLPVASAEG